MAKIMLIGTNMMNLYNHRLELIEELIESGYSVYVVAPRSGEEKELEKIGVIFIHSDIDNRGTSISKDFKCLLTFLKIFRSVKPDVILTFYTKTNIYGGLAARITRIPYIENITGLGSAVSKGGLLGKLMTWLYSAAVKDARMVFFQNTNNQQFFHDHNIKIKAEKLLPGSGVSLNRHPVLPYPDSNEMNFVFLSRILKEKGIFEYVDAARRIEKKYPNVVFHVVGPCDYSLKDYLEKCKKERIVHVQGKIFDVNDFISKSHCVILPSYYAEGMANVLLESAACGRPLITTDMPGCKETVDDNVSGYIVKPRDVDDLVDKIEKFINLPHSSKIEMGLAGRRKMEKEFDRKIVVDAYIDQIEKILKE